ncbi:MAG: putative toxin-antitoxin system toxin component, PIN family [Defluviicoccus sp.]|nr:putative toxin-antitoxin system toxin component, PIN family [Defluviicoccus sp.]
MTAPRVVLDTNVLLSALLFAAHTLAWLRHAWQSGSIRPLASRATTEELIRVLAYPKFALTERDREDLLDDYLPCCEAIAVPEDSRVPHCRDPSDRPFLALALAGEADALVTGDKDLLAHADGFGVPVLTPAGFRERMLEEAR